jgi:superfamily II DNA/RNA helicase
MGFIDDVEKICAMTPKTRQTCLFSATFDGAIGRLAANLTREPVRIDARAEKSAPLAIEQRVHFADDRSHKYRLLDHLLSDIAMRQSIVFIATKRDAEALAIKLQGEGHAAAALHGDMNQRERNRTLSDLRRGGVRTLVATDVAARGIDVPGLTHVINFDLPRQAEDYVHRIGRTGRAGASGVAVSFANHAERGTLRSIERFTGTAIPTQVIPGLEPRLRATASDRPARRPGYGGHGSPRGSAPASFRGKSGGYAAGTYATRGEPARKYGRDR